MKRENTVFNNLIALLRIVTCGNNNPKKLYNSYKFLPKRRFGPMDKL